MHEDSMIFQRSAATATTVLAMLGLAAVAWVVGLGQMNGMDMGTATQLGPFGSFLSVWVTMMAAMMLPGAIPAVLRRAQRGGVVRVVPLFVASYLAVWALVGVAVYWLYQPHDALAAGVIVMAAGAYELTPVKQEFRRRCQETTGTGFEFGLCCVGSSIGLMLILIVLGLMNATWMLLVTLIIFAQKLLPRNVVIDTSLALSLAALGILMVVAPSWVPGFVSPM
jgi:predicted metal-binding membrane protein